MDNHTVVNFENFLLLNESKTLGKMDLGIIGPLANWSMKLQAYPAPNHGMIGYAIDEEDNLELTYLEKKIKLPSKCCDVKKTPSFASIEIKPYTSWFSKEENREMLENFIEDYINDKTQQNQEEVSSVKNDVQIILDSIGIQGNVTDCRKISDCFYEADLDNGLQVEIKKSNSDDLFKNVKIYKDSNSKFADIKLKRNGIGKFIEFRCPGGIYSESADSISQLFKMPTTKYLMCVCLGSLEKDKETDLLSHLQKLIRYHSKETNNVKKYEMEKEEIQRLKDILSHTLKTSDLEEMVGGLSPEK